MLTLKHFLYNPSWAAADGYDFNYLDCMSYTTQFYGNLTGAIRNVFRNFLDTTLGELPMVIIAFLIAVIGLVAWPLCFWLFAILVWFKCKRMRNKYQFGGAMNATARNNLDSWKAECERMWRTKP